MVQKRPHGEESFEVSSKQPRQLESSDEMVSSLEFPDENAASKRHSLGELGEFPIKGKSECEERFDDGNGAELRTFLEKELEASYPGCISNSSWAASTTSEEDSRSEAPFHIFLSPDQHDIDHPLRNIIRVGDIYSSLLEFPPRKLVPVGSDYQADIPEWHPNSTLQESLCFGDTSQAVDWSSQSKSDASGDSDDEGRFGGTCIIPMPEADTFDNDLEKIGAGRINCSCEDEGSITCVQQHITEAREKLKATLGEETFNKLGFCDMGEVVAEKWSKEEELIFHEVVSSNPATLGKNFWNYLPVEFHLRTMKEIVSYYFNVFMLRKRALQNRSYTFNIDSDDDEWGVTDDSADFAIENGKERDDSAVDSPVCEDEFVGDEFHEVHKCGEDGFPKISVHNVFNDLGEKKVICSASENFPGEAFDNHGTFLPINEVISNDELHENMHKTSKDSAPETSGHDACENLSDKKVISDVHENDPVEAFDNQSTVPAYPSSDSFLSNEPGSKGVRDGECTSDDAARASEEVTAEDNSPKQWTGNLSGMGSNDGKGLLLEPCSSKEWDAGYLNCSKNEDFLPTCSMIEEVFGNEVWNNHKTADG